MESHLLYQRPLMLISVDDDTDQLNLIENLSKELRVELTFKGFTCGEDLLSYLSQMQNNAFIYDQVVLLDVNMPKMSGFETLEEIRKMKNLANDLKIAMITGSVDQKRRQTSLELGANLILEKPFELDGWKKMLESVIQLSLKN